MATRSLEVNEWIESVMRSDYLWNNDIPAQDKLDFSADPQTFFSSMLSLKDGKTRNGKHLYYYSYMEKNKDYKARTSIDADDTYGLSGNFWLVSFKISYLCLPLFYETRTTPSCHPSGCAYRQL